MPPKDIAEPNDLVQYYWIYSAPIEQRQEAEYKPVAYRVASLVISFADVHLLTSGVDGEEFKLAREQSGNFHLVTEAEAQTLLQQIQTGKPK